jgi:2-polyprenyl-3-methyl-5-hydroxy-6-metoxy-1,4-benzoquinol methylase
MESDYYKYFKNLRKKYLRYFSKDSLILDIGCGDGSFMRLLEENNYSTIGIDTDASCVKKCQENNFRAFEMAAISFLQRNKNSFGGIICSHLIEHIPSDSVELFFKACYAAMCKNSSLLIITPNVNHIGGCANFWNDPTHIRPYTESSLRKLISKNRFKIKCIGYDKNSGLSIRNNIFTLTIDMLRKILSIMIYGKNGIYTELFVIAEKR